MMNVDDVFRAALRLQDSARLKLLAQLDAPTRRQVELLLEADDAANQEAFLEISSDLSVAASSRTGEIKRDDPSTMVLNEPGKGDEEQTQVGQQELAQWTNSTGRQIGNFRILKQIGRGGMGVVYEAIEQPLNRHVALKVLPPGGLIDGTQRERFRNDSRAAAQLQHPNIVPVYSVGDQDGVLYFAMRLVRGQNLAQIIQDIRRNLESRTPGGSDSTPRAALSGETRESPGAENTSRPRRRSGSQTPLTEDDCLTGLSAEQYPSATSSGRLSHGSRRYFETVARIGLHAALALDHAHQVGIVHRDVKPGNLMIDTSGHLWVTDFGLAQIRSTTMEAARDITQEGDILGTLRYMSPEQASGRKGFVDNRTDIYSLGCTLYELLTLKKAIPGQSAREILHFVSFSTPPQIRKHNPRIPVELEVIVRRAMERDPANRYPTAAALANDLECFLAGEPISARKPSLWRRCESLIKQHKTIATSVAVIMLVIFVASLTATGTIYRSMEEERRHRIEAEAEKMHANGQRLIALSTLNLTRDPGLALCLAVRGAELANGPEAHAALVAAMDANHEQLTLPLSRPAGTLAASPDGRWIVSCPQSQSPSEFVSTAAAVIHDLRGREVERHLQSQTPILDATFDDSGRWLLTTVRPAVDSGSGPVPVLWETTTWKRQRTFSDWVIPAAESNVFSRRGSALVACGRDSGAAVLSTETGDVLLRLPLNDQRIVAACFDSRGDTIATFARNGELTIWNGDSGERLRRVHSPPHAARRPPALTFTADGRHVVVVRRTGTTFYPVSSEAGDPVFFREQLVSVSQTQPFAVLARNFYPGVVLLDTQSVRVARTVDTQWPVDDLCIGKDAFIVITKSGSESAVATYSIHDGQRLSTLQGHAGRVTAAQFGARSQTVLTAGRDSTIRLWDIQSGEDKRRLVSAADLSFSRFHFDSTGAFIGVAQAPEGVTEVRDRDGLVVSRELRGSAGDEESYSDDLVVTRDHRTIFVWDSSSRREVAQRTFSEEILFATAVPEAPCIVASTQGGHVWLWNLETNSATRLTAPNESASYSVASGFVCLGATSGEARVIDPFTGRVLDVHRHETALVSAVVNRDRSRLISLDSNNIIRLHRPGSDEADIVIREPAAEYTQVRLINNDELVLAHAHSGDHHVRIWNASTGELTGELDATDVRWVFEHPERPLLCLVFENAPPLLWNYEDDQRQVLGSTPSPFACFIGDRIVTATRATDARPAEPDNADLRVMGLLHFRDLDSGELLSSTALPFAPLSLTSFADDGRFVLTTERYAADIRTSHTNEHVARINGHAGGIVSIRFLDDESVLTTSTDGGVRTFDLQGQLLSQRFAHTARLVASDTSPDGALLITGDVDGNLLLWNVGSEEAPRPLSKHPAGIETIRFTDDHLVTTLSRDGLIRVWDLRDDSPREFQPERGAIGAELSPDGKWLLVMEGAISSTDEFTKVSPAGASIIQVDTGSQRDLPFRNVVVARIAPDGQHYAVLDDSGTVSVVSATDHEVTRIIRLPGGRIHAISFAPLEPVILTWQTDGLSLWDIDSGAERTRYRCASPPLRLAGSRYLRSWNPWSPDGKQFVTTGFDVLKWPTAPLRSAREQQPRLLTPEEEHRFAVPSVESDGDA